MGFGLFILAEEVIGMKINCLDNVVINLENGHKYAIVTFKRKASSSTAFPSAFNEGYKEHVHVHNVKTRLEGFWNTNTILPLPLRSREDDVTF